MPIYASGIDDGVPWMALRLLSGGSLSERIARGPIPRDQAISILQQAADALDHAHGSGVLHRDIKPQNLPLDERGHVFVADFGIAKIVEGTTEPDPIPCAPRAPSTASSTGLEFRLSLTPTPTARR